MAEEKIMADGLFYKDKHPKAPEWVIAGLSIKVDEFAKCVKEHKGTDEYLNFQVLRSKGGKPYVTLDTWKPEKKQETQQQEPEIDEEPLPF